MLAEPDRAEANGWLKGYLPARYQPLDSHISMTDLDALLETSLDDSGLDINQRNESEHLALGMRVALNLCKVIVKLRELLHELVA